MPSLRTISRGPVMLAAETAGSGAPVVFLHASVCDRRIMRRDLASGQ